MAGVDRGAGFAFAGGVIASRSEQSIATPPLDPGSMAGVTVCFQGAIKPDCCGIASGNVLHVPVASR